MGDWDKRKIIYAPVLVALGVFALCAIFIFTATDLAEQRVAQETMVKIQSNAAQIARNVSYELRRNESVLQYIAAQEDLVNPTIDIEANLTRLKEYAHRDRVARVGIADPTGLAFVSDNIKLNVNHEDWFNEALTGKVSVQTDYKNKLGSKELIYAVAAPYYQDGRQTGVVFLNMYMSELLRMTNFARAEQNIDIYLMDKDLIPFSEQNEILDKSFLQAERSTSREEYETFANCVQSGATGVAEIHRNDKDELVACAPVPAHEGWSIVITVPKEEISLTSSQTATFLLLVGWAASIAAMLLSGALSYYYLKMNEDLETERNLQEMSDECEVFLGLRSPLHIKLAIQQSLPNMNTNETSVIMLAHIPDFKKLEKLSGYEFAAKVRKAHANKLRWLESGDLNVGIDSRDNYYFFATGLSTRAACIKFAQGIQAAIDETLYIGESNIRIHSLMGVRIFFKSEFGANDADYLIDGAKEALAKTTEQDYAKGIRGTNFYIFDQETRDDMQRAADIERDLPFSIERGELTVLYQPILNLRTNEVHSYEALLRWRHPKWGLLRPGEFIALAEKTGFITEVGKWALGEINRNAPVFSKMNTAQSMNISPVELLSSRVSNNLCMPSLHNLRPGQLILEIPEKALIHTNEQIAESIERIIGCGFDVCIDEYWNSSNDSEYLRDIEVDYLKIKGTYLKDIEFSKEAQLEVKLAVDLAKIKGATVIAKGISSASQIQALLDCGCEYGQGMYFSRPLLLENIEKRMGQMIVDGKWQFPGKVGETAATRNTRLRDRVSMGRASRDTLSSKDAVSDASENPSDEELGLDPNTSQDDSGGVDV